MACQVPWYQWDGCCSAACLLLLPTTSAPGENPKALTPSAPEGKVAPPSGEVGQAVADAHAAFDGAVEAGAIVAGAARAQGCVKLSPQADVPGGLG